MLKNYYSEKRIETKKMNKNHFLCKMDKSKNLAVRKNKDVYGMDDENVKAITMMGNDGI